MRALDLTTQQLAVRAGVTGGALRHVLRGFRGLSYQLAGQLADALGVPMDWFRGGHLPPGVAGPELLSARARALEQAGRQREVAAQLAVAAAGGDLDAAGGVVEPAIAAAPAIPSDTSVSSPTAEEEEAAFLRERRDRLGPYTPEERRLMSRYAGQLRGRGRSEVEAGHAALDRLELVWRKPKPKNRGPGVAQDRRSAARSTRGPAKKRRQRIGTAVAEEGRRVAELLDQVDADQGDAADPAGAGRKTGVH
jgi:transcriptional regulator with XRE-family HTH domain